MTHDGTTVSWGNFGAAAAITVGCNGDFTGSIVLTCVRINTVNASGTCVPIPQGAKSI